MLRQLQALFMINCIVMPVTGVWSVNGAAQNEIIVVTTIALQVWLYIGYRRRTFPAWSWLIEATTVTSDVREVGCCASERLNCETFTRQTQ